MWIRVLDTGVDTGTDTGVDTGTDTGVDTSVDTGVASEVQFFSEDGAGSDLANHYAGVTDFGGGHGFEFANAVDPHGVYDRVGRIDSGYGWSVHTAFVAFTNIGEGFALLVETPSR